MVEGVVPLGVPLSLGLLHLGRVSEDCGFLLGGLLPYHLLEDVLRVKELWICQWIERDSEVIIK